MKSPHLRVAALQALLPAWAPITTALAESPSSIHMAVAGPDKLTTTMSFTKDGKMSIMQEALSSVVPHASRLGDSGDGIPGVVAEEKQEQQRHLQQGVGNDGGGWDGITGGAVVMITPTATAAAVSTATRTTTVVARNRAAEAAPLGLGIDRHPVTTRATGPFVASVSTSKAASPSLQTNDAASRIRWRHDKGVAVTAIWIAVGMAFGSIARFLVASST